MIVAEDFGVGSIVPPVFIHRSIVVVPFGKLKVIVGRWPSVLEAVRARAGNGPDADGPTMPSAKPARARARSR